MQIADIFIIIMVLTRFVIGIALVRVAVNTPGARSRRWLAVEAFANGVFNLFTTSFAFSQVLFLVGWLIAQPALVMFNHETFYKDRKSPYLVFMAVTIVAMLAAIVTALMGGSALLATFFSTIAVVANWLWHGALGYQAYRSFASDPSVEDWIKSRYKLMTAYALTLAFVQIVRTVRDAIVSGPLFDLIGLVLLVCAVTALVLQFLVWIMPNGFRNWLNRNYHPPIEEAANL